MLNNGAHANQLADRADRREGYLTDRRFYDRFHKMLRNRVSNPRTPTPGVDNATAAQQALAAVRGRNNNTQPKRASVVGGIDPMKAAMEHAVRNRAAEQGVAKSTQTVSAGAPSSRSSVFNQLKERGLL